MGGAPNPTREQWMFVNTVLIGYLQDFACINLNGISTQMISRQKWDCNGDVCLGSYHHQTPVDVTLNLGPHPRFYFTVFLSSQEAAQLGNWDHIMTGTLLTPWLVGLGFIVVHCRMIGFWTGRRIYIVSTNHLMCFFEAYTSNFQN